MVNKKILMALAGLCISASLCADVYSDRLVRIMNGIANEYDASDNSIDPENMTSVALQAINFITVENDISKNSPLGIKNKYITKHAQALQTMVVDLLKLIRQLNSMRQNQEIKNKPSVKKTMLQQFWKIESGLKQLEGEIEEIKKKQLLPLTKVQKDLVNLLALLAAKNLAVTQDMILMVGKL
jgi:hypothetical protein